MARRFLTDDAKKALTGAIKSCEGCSSAELVIAVRARSASYLHADLLAGLIAAVAALIFIIYSAYSFPMWSIVIDPIASGLIVGLLASRVPAIRRLLTPASIRRRWVRRGAEATFYQKRVRQTMDRTGILIYISLTEQMADAVIDTGVESAVNLAAWDNAVAKINAVVAGGGDGAAVATTIEALGVILEPALERSPDDINELPDEVGEE